MKSRPKGRRADRVKRYVARDGTVREYRYAPRSEKPQAPGDDFASLMAAWQRSPEWRKLAEATKRHYAHYLQPLNRVGHIKVRQVNRADLLAVRDSIATTRGDGAAHGFVRAVSALMSWALDRTMIDHHPLLHGAKGLERGTLRPWTLLEAETAMRALPEPLRRVVVLATFTAQRRGDLCALRWSQWDGQVIRLTQQKTSETVAIPCHPRLRAEMEQWAQHRTAVTILTDPSGKPWKPNLLSHYLPAALARIGLSNELNVHGLRKLAATCLAEAGCSAHEIAAIGGWRSLQMVEHYTRSVDRERLAGAAILRLEAWDENRTKKSRGR